MALGQHLTGFFIMAITIYAIAHLLNLCSIGYALVNLVKHEKAFTKSVEAVCHICYAALAVSVLLNAFVIYRLLIRVSDYLLHPEYSVVWLTVGGLTVAIQYFVGFICKGVEHDTRFRSLQNGFGHRPTL
jgi:hypothetical protein